MERPGDNSLEELNCYLDQVASDLEGLCDAGFAVDPDTLAAKLDLDALLIQETVDSLLAQAELSKLEMVHVNDVINHASKEFLMTRSEPVVIRTSLSSDVPELPRDMVREFAAAAIRSLQMIADIAPGHTEIAIASGADLGQAVIRICAQGDMETIQVPLELRTCTLKSMIHDLGGRFETHREHDRIELTLRLPTVAQPFSQEP